MSALVLFVICQVQISIDAKRLNPSDQMMVRFTIENLGETAVEVDEPTDWTTGLEVRDAKDRVLKEPAATTAKGKVRLEGRGFTGRSVNVAGLVAGKEFEEGTWRLTWKHMGGTSQALEVLVVRNWQAKIATNYGDLTIDLLPENAPKSVLHFMKLVREGVYTRKSFYRVIDRYIIQAGLGPQGDQKRQVRAEFTDRKHSFGTLSMARVGNDPDSASTEFFICLEPQPGLDRQYTIIGELADGQKTLRTIGGVKTDHSPCPGCGKEVAPGPSEHCSKHHKDRPEVDVIIKEITLTERK